MKLMRELVNFLVFASLRAISPNVVAVGPGSLKVQPPNATNTDKPGSAFLRLVRRLTRSSSLGPVSMTSKLMGSMVAKAKFRCVYINFSIYSR